MKKKTERNGKNYGLNGFLRGQFLDSKAKTKGIVLNLLKAFENSCVIVEEVDFPKNKDELRLTLGMTNFTSMFIENYFSVTAELRKLLHKYAKWEWNDKHFEILKNSLKDHCMLDYFDPKSNAEVICDASPYGLSSIFTQYCKDDNVGW